MISNKEINNRSRALLKGNWGVFVLIVFLYMLVSGFVNVVNQMPSSEMGYDKDFSFRSERFRNGRSMNGNFWSGICSSDIGSSGFGDGDSWGFHRGYSCDFPSRKMWMGMERGHGLDGVFSFALTIGFHLVVLPALFVGFVFMFLGLFRRSSVQMSDIFYGVKKKFAISIQSTLLCLLYILLWSLLFIIPGIIAWVSYILVPYIIADNDGINPHEALKKSKAMMRGNKAQFFWLVMRFAGWFVLSILSGGLGFLWLMPYFQASVTGFYEEICTDETTNSVLDMGIETSSAEQDVPLA